MSNLETVESLRARVEELEREQKENDQLLDAIYEACADLEFRGERVGPASRRLKSLPEVLTDLQHQLATVTAERDDTQEELRLTIEQRDHLHLQALELEKVWEAAKHRFLRIEQQLAERDTRIARVEELEKELQRLINAVDDEYAEDLPAEIFAAARQAQQALPKEE